jgi:protein-S-isoprenylcysteine O-methyltransferase Ste14
MAVPRPTRSRLHVFLAAVGLLVACWLGAFAGLWQWGKPVGWARFDVFSTSALLLSALFVLQHIYFWVRLPASRETALEAFGATYDPRMGLWNSLLLLGETAVFFDYGHWHLTPWLEHAPLQAVGLALYVCSLALVVWADRYLVRYFTAPESDRRLITAGPYRYLRHPRYAGLFLSRIAFALTFASGLAWAFVPAWALAVTRRIRIEEGYLLRRYGDAYASYMARRTPGPTEIHD